jgi:hypothetical protein
MRVKRGISVGVILKRLSGVENLDGAPWYLLASRPGTPAQEGGAVPGLIQGAKREREEQMGKPKVMKLVDPYTGLMECRVCGSRHHANFKFGGRYRRGSWQCINGCKLPGGEGPTSLPPNRGA